MTRLSVNLNKIALLRNSRGRDYPSVLEYARKFIGLGVGGITVHPRQDERHARRQDARELAALAEGYPEVEFNIEGYPSDEFLSLIEEVRPDQCTLVPDDVNQVTSDHGWDITGSSALLADSLERIHAAGVRSSLFLDPDPEMAREASGTGAHRIELYTEQFAETYGSDESEMVLERYRETAEVARSMGLGVNAGHDLNLDNLAVFLGIGNVLEVSIGHAMTIECIDHGIERVVARYLQICHGDR